MRANQRQSYHDEGHSEFVGDAQIKRERESSPDLEEQLFAPLTNQVFVRDGIPSDRKSFLTPPVPLKVRGTMFP